MMRDIQAIGLIGFGEAGRTFAMAGDWGGSARVYDRLTTVSEHRASMLAQYRTAGVVKCESLHMIGRDVSATLSLVTADQSLAVARSVALSRPPALFLDMTSVAPQTKREAAREIEHGGGAYVDVAIMSPVQPLALDAPLLLSGAEAEAAAALLRALGFRNVGVVGDQVGRASAIKMIRSVMVKGLEALSVECLLAAGEADVLDEVLDSLDASWPGPDWRRRGDYNLDRMMVHGVRRAAEMEEAVRTLDDLGVPSAFTRGTVLAQRAVGEMGLRPPPEGLDAKLAAMRKDIP